MVINLFYACHIYDYRSSMTTMLVTLAVKNYNVVVDDDEGEEDENVDNDNAVAATAAIRNK